VECLGCLVWRFDVPVLALSTAPAGGGIGLRDWTLNAQVARDYARCDPETHVNEIAARLGLLGSGVGMLTAVDIKNVVIGESDGVIVEATVGLTLPVWAAAPASVAAGASAEGPGTINLVAFVPARHSEAALANLACTVTEAKVQALLAGGVDGTGTASDAVTVLCPASGAAELFGGPRSQFGAPLARAVCAAVAAGVETS
jgi:adenosylcobinamide amidohydrolase